MITILAKNAAWVLLLKLTTPSANNKANKQTKQQANHDYNNDVVMVCYILFYSFFFVARFAACINNISGDDHIYILLKADDFIALGDNEISAWSGQELVYIQATPGHRCRFTGSEHIVTCAPRK